jgi:probable F420-dependent oxidoreductase
MKLGITFPQQTIGDDPVAIRDFAQGAESAGFDYISAGEHVLGAHPDRNPDRPAFTHEMAFHEPMTLFAYLAAVTERIELVSAVLVLPQRQTALVAKQAAEIDLLSGGRLRLGIGVGWNVAEFEALGVDFEHRGTRAEEQIELMRRLWSEPLLSFDGRFHKLDRVAILPRPKAPIPVWIGCNAEDRLLRRVARIADGWIPQGDIEEPMQRLTAFLKEEGRDPASFSVTSGVTAGPEGPDTLVAAAKRLRSLGVTHLGVRVPAAPDEPALKTLERASEARRVIAEGLA